MRRSLKDEISELVSGGTQRKEQGEEEEDAEFGDGARVVESTENEDQQLERSSLRTRASAPELDPSMGGKPVSRADLSSWFEGGGGATTDDDEESEEEEGVVRTKATEEADLLQRELEREEKGEDKKKIQTKKEGEGSTSTTTTHATITEDGEFSVIGRNSTTEDEQEKSQHAQTQSKLWDIMMETRIHIQPVLAIAGRLPRPEMNAQFCEHNNNSEVRNAFRNARNEAVGLLCDLDTLNCELWNTNKEICDMCGRIETAVLSEDEMKNQDSDKIWNHLQSRQKAFTHYQNEIIDKWHQRTLIGASGIASAKKFKAMNISISKQIEQALEDKQRLLKRTHIRRIAGRVIGGDISQSQQTPSTSSSSQEDFELFDDADFYGELLRELIESSNRKGDDLDSLAASTELNSLKRKKPRQMVKTSKGRTIKYDVYPELVNFMAPIDSNIFRTDWDTDQLFAHLFGQQTISQ